MVPNLEKILVDHEADKEYQYLSDEDIQKEYQRAFEVYPVNTSRLLRYAGRKGKKDESLQHIARINQERVKIVRSIQDYFSQEPVNKAWLFGSFSRMEERPDSDIDILVDLDRSVPMGLLQYAGMIHALEGILGKKVDMVAEGSVKPFARDSINQDKILIYERAV
ncbi:MAG: nucleotidyltransferase domain-containing protein [Bacteroidales bacterium]|nr:nucleotidyltransferase domain-containing protein [Bacteroidales bacterium]